MTANHKRILKLLLENITEKIAHNKTEESQIKALEREVQRNKAILSNLDYEEKVVFINDIITKLKWSPLLVNKVLKEEQQKEAQKEKIKVSAEKMMIYSELYETESVRLQREIAGIKNYDSEDGKYDILYGRLKGIESAKGSAWKEDEIDFVVEKRNMGYSFKAIATILKRPERVVYLKYHENK